PLVRRHLVHVRDRVGIGQLGVAEPHPHVAVPVHHGEGGHARRRVDRLLRGHRRAPSSRVEAQAVVRALDLVLADELALGQGSEAVPARIGESDGLAVLGAVEGERPPGDSAGEDALARDLVVPRGDVPAVHGVREQLGGVGGRRFDRHGGTPLCPSRARCGLVAAYNFLHSYWLRGYATPGCRRCQEWGAHMSLRAALLALISAGPLTGYDAVKHFRSSVGHVWHAPDSQIYPELRKMQAEGLLKATEVPWGRKGATKTQYAISPAGREALAQWQATPLQYAPERDQAHLLAAYFEWGTPETARERLREHIAAYEAAKASALKQAQDIRERTSPTLQRRLAGYDP